MSGSRPKSVEERLAEQHLGDRLAALVDGELGHDARERVLAHVATCARCKAEVDAQRRLKNVFAEAAPPPLSESFLARLQGLPGGGDDDGGGPPDDGFLDGVPGPGRPPAGLFGSKRGERFEFGYVPAGPHAPVLPASGTPRGFRIHEVRRPDAERSAASRSRRFAFVAAGAVSLAAIALGGVTTGMPGDTTTDARGGNGSNVTPMRTPGAGATTGGDSQRRRGVGPVLAQGQRSLADTPLAATEASAPLLPGVPSTSASDAAAHEASEPLTTAVEAGAAAMSPLIRPFSVTPPLTLTAWSEVADVMPPGLLAGPLPGLSGAPSAGPSVPAR
ncbi:zf-HC2 domain-containing protein [Streptomyces sp. NPDC091377]|uniref:zf-HC2 domain-containing protein n=1 Tax=Streptomyces sp. NPDC091377 TaxID=3365995 RepID=UPI00382072DF